MPIQKPMAMDLMPSFCAGLGPDTDGKEIVKLRIGGTIIHPWCIFERIAEV